uniref:Liprin-beta-1 n=1 Tax=Lygus hesperus TaxID=30085 RepID=A0A0A9X6M7_LYGHE
MNSTQPLIVLMLWCLAVLTANALELKASDSKALTYIWDVNLDEFNGTNNLLSPRFTTWNGTVEEPWQLWFNLHGASYLNKECLDLYLVHRKSHHVKIDFTLLLFNQKDEKDSASHHWQGVTFKDSSTGHGTGPCFKGDLAVGPPKGIYAPGRGYVVDGKIKLGVRIPTDPIPIKPTIELLQLRRLEDDKKSLTLQVSNLTSQVEAKSNKIDDLEKTVSEQKKQISASEDLLQRSTNELREQLRRLEADTKSLSLHVNDLNKEVDVKLSRINYLERTVFQREWQISQYQDLLQRVGMCWSSLNVQLRPNHLPPRGPMYESEPPSDLNAVEFSSNHTTDFQPFEATTSMKSEEGTPSDLKVEFGSNHTTYFQPFGAAMPMKSGEGPPSDIEFGSNHIADQHNIEEGRTSVF